MKCSEAEAFSDAYVDGELAGVDRDVYERHLLDCDQCSRCCRLHARFKAAVRGHLGHREAPEGLRRRIEVAIAAAPPPPRRWSWQLYPRLTPAVLATSALVAVVLMARGQPSAVLPTMSQMFNAEMPMDIRGTSCASIAEWFRGRVAFSVKPPAEAPGTRCEGGRLVNVRDRLAAYLTLQALNGHRVGVMVLDSEDDELDAIDQRLVRGRDIRVGTYGGASTAAFRSWDGLTYIVTSDVDPDQVTNFVNVAFPH